MNDPTALSLAAAADALAAGRLTSGDLVEATLERIARLNPSLNAFIRVDADGARAMARASDRRRARRGARSPLEGIPLALKDNIDQRGLATTNGLARGPVATRDARATARLRTSGAVLLGKLNMHECAFGGSTRNPHWGNTHNPWRHGFTPGGSSGGSGAAVAARLAFGALGTDTMGSVRLPAAYCGVVGFKPTHGLIANRGVLPLSRSLDQVGPLARSVHDVGLLYEVLAGSGAGDPVRSRECVAALRLGVIANLAAIRCTSGAAAAFEALLGRLRAAGASLETLDLPDCDPRAARRAGLLVIEAEGAQALSVRGGAWSAPSADTARLFAYGSALSRRQVGTARRTIAATRDALHAAFARVEAIVSLTAPQAAFSFAESDPVNQAEFTAPANFADCPALSIPFALDDGLPLGLQVMAASGNDARLLSIGAVLERWLGFDAAPSLEGTANASAA